MSKIKNTIILKATINSLLCLFLVLLWLLSSTPVLAQTHHVCSTYEYSFYSLDEHDIANINIFIGIPQGLNLSTHSKQINATFFSDIFLSTSDPPVAALG